MRILVFTPSYPPKIGGGERYAQAIAQAAVAAGHQVTVVTTDIADNPDFWRWHPALRDVPPTRAREDGITVIRYPAVGVRGGWPGLTLWRKAMVVLGAFGPSTARLLERMSRRIPAVPGLADSENLPDCDLIHVYNLSWEYPLVVGWRLAQQRAVPLVVTPFAHLGVNVSARVTRNITMPHQLQVLRRADAILALPSAEAEGLAALGLAPQRIHVVGSGYDMPHD
ncbi:MAG: glycosyltransferase, partial [Anaerolineae bacterium]